VAPPRGQLGELTALLRPSSWLGWGWLPLPKNHAQVSFDSTEKNPGYGPDDNDDDDDDDEYCESSRSVFHDLFPL